MKVLIFVACALATASATYVPSFYGFHVPVIGPNGVPVETPEVQHAKAAHFAAHAEASGRAYAHPQAVVYAGHYGVPQIAPDGTPLDTPEVALAKANHFAALNSAAVNTGHYYAAPYAVSAAGPVDTPEVQLAKAAHFAAHAEAKSRSGHYRKRRDLSAYAYGIPAIAPNGVPLDTPEVQVAKAKHFADYAVAAARNGVVAPIYAAHSYAAYPYQVPLIGHNGVPLDTPEVQAEKAKHFAAHVEANTRSAHLPIVYGGYYGNPWAYGVQANGAPLDTPEVQAAKIEHFAAHAAARAHL